MFVYLIDLTLEVGGYIVSCKKANKKLQDFDNLLMQL